VRGLAGAGEPPVSLVGVCDLLGVAEGVNEASRDMLCRSFKVVCDFNVDSGAKT
jgi:hypothetical protein